MARRVTVHHFVANLTTRQHSAHPTSDLLGVDYFHDVPADTEFPRLLPKIDLFTRFYLQNAVPCEFFVRVWWLSDPRRKKGRLAGTHGPFLVNFHLAALMHDHVFRVLNIRLLGVGLYELRLVRYRGSGWNSGTAAIFARTHFHVEI